MILMMGKLVKLTVKYKQSNYDFTWGVLAQGLGIGMWLVLLPIALKYLSASEVALLLIFVTISGISQLLELGFQPTIARNISYAYSGVVNLVSTGIDAETAFTPGPNVRLLSELLVASRYIYKIIGILAALFLWIIGTAYIVGISRDVVSIYTVIVAWISFSTGYIINLSYGYINSFLQGKGDMLEFNKVSALFKATQIVLSVLFLMCGYGLIGLGFASLIATILGRVLAYKYVKLELSERRSDTKLNSEKINRLIKIIWHNSSRYGVAMLGAFLVSRACVLVVTSKIGLEQASGFILALQILISLQNLSTIPFSLIIPKLNALQAQGVKLQILRLFSKSLVTSLSLFISSGLIFIIFGNKILIIIGSSSNLPSMTILVILCLVFLLELNHGICANLITTTNQVPFVRAALITGVMITVSAWIIAPYLGILGVVIMMGFWQLLYNNWKWPYAVSKLFGLKYIVIIQMGFLRLWFKIIR